MSLQITDKPGPTIVSEPLDDERTKEKENLRHEIQKLKAQISEIDTVSVFGNIENIESEFQQSNIPSTSYRKVPNIEYIIKQEIHKYLGFYCNKISKNECMFKLCVPNYNKTISTYYIQFLDNDGVYTIGKYMLPLSVDIASILSDISVHNVKPKTILQKCKHYIECYHDRQRQFFELKTLIQDLKNCELFSNQEYTYISLQLLWAQGTDLNKDYNFVGHFLYNSEETLPMKITISPIVIGAYSFDDETIENLKFFLKPFKTLELPKAFEKMIKNENSIFNWQPKQIKSKINEFKSTQSDSSDSEDSFYGVVPTKQTSKKRRKYNKKHKANTKASQESDVNETDFYENDDQNEDKVTRNSIVKKKGIKKATTVVRNDSTQESQTSDTDIPDQIKPKRRRIANKNKKILNDSKQKKLTEGATISKNTSTSKTISSKQMSILDLHKNQTNLDEDVPEQIKPKGKRTTKQKKKKMVNDRKRKTLTKDSAIIEKDSTLETTLQKQISISQLQKNQKKSDNPKEIRLKKITIKKKQVVNNSKQKKTQDHATFAKDISMSKTISPMQTSTTQKNVANERDTRLRQTKLPFNTQKKNLADSPIIEKRFHKLQTLTQNKLIGIAGTSTPLNKASLENMYEPELSTIGEQTLIGSRKLYMSPKVLLQRENVTNFNKKKSKINK